MAHLRGSHRAADREQYRLQRRRRGRARDPSIGIARRSEVYDDDRIRRLTLSYRDYIHPENVQVEDPIHYECRRTDRLDRDKQRHHSYKEDTVQHRSDPESRTRFVSDYAEAFSRRIDV
jgi:exonuclease I